MLSAITTVTEVADVRAMKDATARIANLMMINISNLESVDIS